MSRYRPARVLPYALAATAFAGGVSATDLTRRLDALHSLEDLFSHNVQESLAIEAVFLKAFGSS